MTKSQQIQLVAEGFELVLEGLGLDITDPHLEETPERAAKAWVNELCAGLRPEAEPKITTFPNEDDTDGLILLRDIPVRSVCSHHLLPFIGTANVAYIPGNGHILGLSKLSRIVNFFARRPQVQERLTKQVADYLFELVCPVGPDVVMETSSPLDTLRAGGVGVVIKATHMCMTLRGVSHHGEMITSELRGVFRDQPAVREEFMALAGEER